MWCTSYRRHSGFSIRMHSSVYTITRHMHTYTHTGSCTVQRPHTSIAHQVVWLHLNLALALYTLLNCALTLQSRGIFASRGSGTSIDRSTKVHKLTIFRKSLILITYWKSQTECMKKHVFCVKLPSGSPIILIYTF